MICKACCNASHDKCDDRLHERIYRSCDCQHRTDVPNFANVESSDIKEAGSA